MFNRDTGQTNDTRPPVKTRKLPMPNKEQTDPQGSRFIHPLQQRIQKDQDWFRVLSPESVVSLGSERSSSPGFRKYNLVGEGSAGAADSTGGMPLGSEYHVNTIEQHVLGEGIREGLLNIMEKHIEEGPPGGAVSTAPEYTTAAGISSMEDVTPPHSGYLPNTLPELQTPPGRDATTEVNDDVGDKARVLLEQHNQPWPETPPETPKKENDGASLIDLQTPGVIRSMVVGAGNLISPALARVVEYAASAADPTRYGVQHIGTGSFHEFGVGGDQPLQISEIDTRSADRTHLDLITTADRQPPQGPHIYATGGAELSAKEVGESQLVIAGIRIGFAIQIAAGCFLVVRFQQDPSILRFGELSLTFIGLHAVWAWIKPHLLHVVEFFENISDADIISLAAKVLYPLLAVVVYLSVTISLIPSLWAFIFVGTFWLTLKYTGNIVNLLMWVLGLGLLVMIHKVNRYVEMEQHRMREGRRWEHHVDDSGRAYRPVRGADRPI